MSIVLSYYCILLVRSHDPGRDPGSHVLLFPGQGCDLPACSSVPAGHHFEWWPGGRLIWAYESLSVLKNRAGDDRVCGWLAAGQTFHKLFGGKPTRIPVSCGNVMLPKVSSTWSAYAEVCGTVSLDVKQFSGGSRSGELSGGNWIA